jgi:hypothetical protein
LTHALAVLSKEDKKDECIAHAIQLRHYENTIFLALFFIFFQYEILIIRMTGVLISKNC